ncbi:MAG TPA: hypothetical protein VFE48_00300 [Methylomirabilota bacterium]|nr:hypothetical protein [Methylomirabilota bacterium]
MIERVLVGGALTVAAALALPAGAGAAEPGPTPSVILNLTNVSRLPESREKAFTEEVKREALAPQPSPMDDWALQPDGSMKNKKTGISLRVSNPCPPGDIEHEFALAAFNRAKRR